jgi:hypothetical protein
MEIVDLPMRRDGLIPERFLEQLTFVGRAPRPRCAQATPQEPQ